MKKPCDLEKFMAEIAVMDCCIDSVVHNESIDDDIKTGIAYQWCRIRKMIDEEMDRENKTEVLVPVFENVKIDVV